MNKNYKNCDQGHFYPSTFASCPHCQNQSNSTPSAGQGAGDSDKTALMGNATKNAAGLSSDATSPGFMETVKVGTPMMATSSGDSGRTMVVSSSKGSEANAENQGPSPSRKLVGWLVSYTISELGVDFRLYEGQNNIGRDAKNTVRITEDSSISSHHATILFRGGQFYFRDEMSTNPSFVNEEEVMPGNTVKLGDGDAIRVGKTLLMLRISFFNN
jgi:hypothetical protein